MPGGRFSGVLNLVEAYDPSTDMWTTLAPMAVPRAGFAASVVGNRIYTFGGNAFGGGPCSGAALDVAEAYDIASDTWSGITPPPIPVTQAVSVEKGGNIYCLGVELHSLLLLVTLKSMTLSPTYGPWAHQCLQPVRQWLSGH